MSDTYDYFVNLGGECLKEIDGAIIKLAKLATITMARVFGVEEGDSTFFSTFVFTIEFLKKYLSSLDVISRIYEEYVKEMKKYEEGERK